MSDPTEDIADSLVTFLNSDEVRVQIAAQDRLQFQAVKTDYTEDLLTAHDEYLRVCVTPYGEPAEKIGRGGQAMETYSISLMVSVKLKPEIGLDKTRVNHLNRLIKNLIRPERMAGYPWAGDEVAQKFDPDLLRTMNRFACVTRLYYSGTSA